jgi:hypothetical protein
VVHQKDLEAPKYMRIDIIYLRGSSKIIISNI